MPPRLRSRSPERAPLSDSGTLDCEHLGPVGLRPGTSSAIFGNYVQEVTIDDQKPDLEASKIEYYVEIKGDEVPSKSELESALASITETDTKPVIIQKTSNTVSTSLKAVDNLGKKLGEF